MHEPMCVLHYRQRCWVRREFDSCDQPCVVGMVLVTGTRGCPVVVHSTYASLTLLQLFGALVVMAVSYLQLFCAQLHASFAVVDHDHDPVDHAHAHAHTHDPVDHDEI